MTSIPSPRLFLTSKSQIIPRAVDFFTGKIDEYDLDEDEDYEDEEDEDEDEEDFDDDDVSAFSFNFDLCSQFVLLSFPSPRRPLLTPPLITRSHGSYHRTLSLTTMSLLAAVVDANHVVGVHLRQPTPTSASSSESIGLL